MPKQLELQLKSDAQPDQVIEYLMILREVCHASRESIISAHFALKLIHVNDYDNHISEILISIDDLYTDSLEATMKLLEKALTDG